MLKKKAADPLYLRRKKLLSLYGITHEQFVELSTAQKHACAICQRGETRIMYEARAHLVVDHDHESGHLRGLLCHRCNTALAAVENEQFRVKALAYLEYWSKHHAKFDIEQPAVRHIANVIAARRWLSYLRDALKRKLCKRRCKTEVMNYGQFLLGLEEQRDSDS